MVSVLRKKADYTDSKAARGLKKSGGSKDPGPRASNWERLRARGVEGDAATRDVHSSQQLGRSKIQQVKTKKVAKISAWSVGVLVAILAWVISGLGLMGADLVSGGSAESRHAQAVLEAAAEAGVPPYGITEQRPVGQSSLMKECHFPVDAQGNILDQTCVRDSSEIVRPQWHIDATSAALAERGIDEASLGQRDGLGSWLGTAHASLWRVAFSLGLGVLLGGITWMWGSRRTDAVNLMRDTDDINQHDDDQHIALPEEVFASYSPFPNVGAHSPVSPSSLMGHAMISNDGVPQIKIARRYEADVLGEDGEIEHYRGEIVRDESGAALMEKAPMIDEEFSHFLFEMSGVEKSRTLRRFFSPRRVPHNPGGKNRDKTGKQDTIAEHIAADWELPEYEPQRPGGVYLVDEAPVNTMVLAMTRAGKGQTYIEPMIDMWSRERRQHNMVINDPKGELLVKNFVRLAVRGFQVVQFNLINPLKTDIYNPLAMAVQAAREGNSTYVAMYVENIAEVFFPVDGADDPVWPNAANNAFKRTAYGLIDFYMEEERQMRKRALAENWDQKVLDTRLDEMWGKVTLYNCYQLFVQLSAKKLKDPVQRLKAEIDAGKHGDIQNDPAAQYAASELLAEATEQQESWRGEAELDMLTLFFNASGQLPSNSMRTLVANSDNALRSMGAAEKMLASVYGIAITAMSFFVDPTISTLTSGTLSQNVDLAGLSFPRRFGVRFDQDYVRKYNLVGCQVRWDCFASAEEMARAAKGESFEALGKGFDHVDTVSREGWAKAYFDGKFAEEVSFLRLRLLNTASGTLIKTLYFRFTKGYETNLTGRVYVKDPVLGTKIVKNGTMVELLFDGERFAPSMLKFEQEKLNIAELTDEEINSGDNDLIKKVPGTRNAVMSIQANYSEKPKAVFLVTPPHLMKYAKLILILIKQLVDLNFDKSYMTKDNQKPLYKTRYMLDELGNLQSEGNGIAGFETMLSIGLGQEQQFTLILQTLQQLKDVYGDSVDKIVQGNAANLVFLKSTDDTMIDTLTKMSGTMHKAFANSKSVTQDVEKIAMQTEGKVTRQIQLEEVPVISYNDLAFLPPRNSIVFSAGAPPIWNRNEMILPMSFALFGGSPQDYLESRTIAQPGKSYSLQTIPTLSAAKDFDVRLNQPDFFAMVEKRVTQASTASAAERIYRQAYDLDDFQMSRLDPDVASAEIMDINDVLVGRKLYEKARAAADAAEASLDDDLMDVYGESPGESTESAVDFDESYDQDELLAMTTRATMSQATDDNSAVAEQQRYAASAEDAARKRYAEGTVSREMLINPMGGAVVNQLRGVLAAAYEKCWRDFVDDDVFVVTDDGSLVLRRSGRAVIEPVDHSDDLADAVEAARRSGSRVSMEEEPDPDSFAAAARYRLHDEFFRTLAGMPDWEGLARGRFDSEVALLMKSV